MGKFKEIAYSKYFLCVGCNFSCSRKDAERKFHYLPKDKRRAQWLRSLGRHDLIGKKIPTHYRVCGIHFTKEMKGGTQTRLNGNAVPFPIKKYYNNKIVASSDNLSNLSEIENLTDDAEIETDENIRTNVECISPGLRTNDKVVNLKKINQILEEKIKNLGESNTIDISDDENEKSIKYHKVSLPELIILPQTLEKECVEDNASINMHHPNNELSSTETQMENFESNKFTTTIEPSDLITTYKQAIKRLKMLEKYALLKRNFVAITLINNLEEIFEEDL